MCIADLTGSISTELGDFNSVQLSESVFRTSLAPYNWSSLSEFTNTDFEAFGTNFVNATTINLLSSPVGAPIDVTSRGIEVGMTVANPLNPSQNGRIISINNFSIFQSASVTLDSPISVDETDPVIISRPRVSCSIFNISESVQTKDRENACVDFLQFFVGSGSNAPHHSPTTHIFTDDGFDFSVTEDQKILVWQGGQTNQNQFFPANQLSIGTPLVSWANDIYQFVQITSKSFDPNNSISVDWMTTGTNSYQLKNGVVLRGLVDDYCSCKPTASIDGGDIPCESTISYCVSESVFELSFSGSDSGGWEGGTGTAGSTTKTWSLVNKSGPENSTIISASNFANSNQQLTASFSHISQSTKIEICYTESRVLGPVELVSAVPLHTGSLIVNMISQSEHNPNDNHNIFSSSHDASDFTGVPGLSLHNTIDGVAFVVQATLTEGSNISAVYNHVFVYVTGSHGDLDNGIGHAAISPLERNMYHFFCSNSADDGTLAAAHPSYSNAAYSLAWKINSASLSHLKGEHPASNTRTGTTIGTGVTFFNEITTTSAFLFSGFHGFPSASYGHKPKNIVVDGVNPPQYEYESTFEENIIHFVSTATASNCPDTHSLVNSTLQMNSDMDPANGEASDQLAQSDPSSPINYATNPVNINQSLQGGVCPSTGSLGLIAEDSCCFELILNRKPREGFNTSHVCQTGFGNIVNLGRDLPFINADEVTFTLASGSTGYFDGKGLLIVDTQSHAKGKVTICYTASSENPDCTNNADEIAVFNPTVTPDCCPAISGCVDVFFHPGFTAGPDGVHCYPTISLAGTSPIYTFTDTDISEPTWSLGSGNIQFEDYSFNTIPPANADAIFVANNTTFGNITNFTNSYVTEIHLNPDLDADLNFGFFTMSCQVSNGPCTFTDFTTHYAARTYAKAGPDRVRCLGGDNGGPITSNNLIQLQATASSVDPPSGFWSYVSPSGSFSNENGISYSNLIEETNNPTSGYRLAPCTGPTIIRWTESSQSLIIINEDTYSINCQGTDDVTVELKKKPKQIKIRGHYYSSFEETNPASNPTNPQLFTASISVSAGPFQDSPFNYRGPFTNTTHQITPYKIDDEDSLVDLNVFVGTRSNLKFAFELEPEVQQLTYAIHIPSNLASTPHHLYSSAQGSGINNFREFRFRDQAANTIGTVASADGGIRVQNSGSVSGVGGFLSSSLLYMPNGPHNPSLAIHTASVIAFSGSTSASYSPHSGSLFAPHALEQVYYLMSATSSLSNDCACEDQGAQARIHIRLEPETFFIATQSQNVLYNKFPSTGIQRVTGSNETMLEPTIGERCLVYRDVFALNFISESVVPESTGSSVIYAQGGLGTQNDCCFFISCSIKPHPLSSTHKQGGKSGLKPATNKSASLKLLGPTLNPSPGADLRTWAVNATTRGMAYPLTTHSTIYTGGDTKKYPPLYKKSVELEAAGTSLGTGNPGSEFIGRNFHENPAHGMQEYGFGVNFEWRARQINVYGDNGAALTPGGDIPENFTRTGSFLDTFTSESFVEAPTFLPAQRAYSMSLVNGTVYRGYPSAVIKGAFHVDGLESGGDGRHLPYFSPTIGETDGRAIRSQSVMFECTASVRSTEGTLLKQYRASQSVMFIMTEDRPT